MPSSEMQPTSFQRLLVHTDPRQADDPAVLCAQSLAREWKATLTLFDVASDLSWPLQYLAGGWESLIEQVGGEKHRALEERAATLTADGLPVEAVLGNGRLASAIVRQVKEGRHDLVIKRAERAGPDRSGFLSSTDQRLLRDCPCPALILHPDGLFPFRRVAVALDVMDDHEIQEQLDRLVLVVAAAMTDAPLRLVYAMPRLQEVIAVDRVDVDLVDNEQLGTWDEELRQVAGKKLQEHQQRCKTHETTSHVLIGPPEEAMPEFVTQEGIDLLVMGTVARSGLEGMLVGNTAERMFDHLNCSVLAVKPLE